MNISRIRTQGSSQSTAYPCAPIVKDANETISQLGEDGIKQNGSQKSARQSGKTSNCPPDTSLEGALANVLNAVSDFLQEQPTSQSHLGSDSAHKSNKHKMSKTARRQTHTRSNRHAPSKPATQHASQVPAPTSTQTSSSTLDQQQGPISLANASVRADKVGTNYISDSMLQNAEANGGQLKNTAQYDAFIDANAGKFGLDPAVVKRQYRVESGGDPAHVGDTNNSAAQGGPSIGLMQVSEGLLSGGVWAHPGMVTSSGTQLTTGDLQNNPEVQLLAGMEHLADYKNEAAASLGAGASPEAIYTQALGNYVGHDQSSYISNIEKTAV